MSVPDHDRRSTDAQGKQVEEQFEERRHDKLYSNVRDADLRMVPSDWEKFDRCIIPHTNPYIDSVLRLGRMPGKVVLDAGCGDGWLSVILAKRGAAHVDALDISGEAVRLARIRARVNGVSDRITVRQGSMYEIPAPNGHYDLVAGQAILHHVRDKRRCAREIRRVLKPGGLAVFREPLGNSRWLERLRLLIPVPSGAPDAPEHWKDQIRYQELDAVRSIVAVSWREFHLFSRLDRVLKSERILSAIASLDMLLLDRFRFLRPYARAIVIEMRREGSSSGIPRPCNNAETSSPLT